MSVFKKINRGIVLLVALILVVIGYLGSLYFIRRSDRDQITNLTAEYMSVLQEDLILADRDTEQALADATASQLPFFASENAFKPTASVLTNYYELQELYGSINELSLNVIKANEFAFDGDTATVSVTVAVDYDGSANIIDTGNRSSGTTEADFILQKTETGWKLFYYDINLSYLMSID